MGFLLSFVYGAVLACSGLSWEYWQFWVLVALFFMGRLLGFYEGSRD